MKVCWRKLAGTEDSPKHPEVSTEDRAARRLRADNSVEASWEDAPDKVCNKLYIAALSAHSQLSVSEAARSVRSDWIWLEHDKFQPIHLTMYYGMR